MQNSRRVCQIAWLALILVLPGLSQERVRTAERLVDALLSHDYGSTTAAMGLTNCGESNKQEGERAALAAALVSLGDEAVQPLEAAITQREQREPASAGDERILMAMLAYAHIRREAAVEFLHAWASRNGSASHTAGHRMLDMCLAVAFNATSYLSVEAGRQRRFMCSRPLGPRDALDSLVFALMTGGEATVHGPVAPTTAESAGSSVGTHTSLRDLSRVGYRLANGDGWVLPEWHLGAEPAYEGEVPVRETYAVTFLTPTGQPCGESKVAFLRGDEPEGFQRKLRFTEDSVHSVARALRGCAAARE